MTTLLILLAVLAAFTLGCIACWLTIGWKYRLGEKRIAEADALVKAAESEANIWRGVATKNDEIVRAELDKRGGTIEHRTAGLRIMAAEMRSVIDMTKAENYVEINCGDSQGELVLTIQKLERPTPHDFRVKAEQRVKELEAEIERMKQGLTSDLINPTPAVQR